MKKIEDVEHKKTIRGVSDKYRPIFDLEQMKDGRGPAVEVENTPKNYQLYIKGVLPRWNKRFAPKHWVHHLAFNDAGSRVIRIQRDA